MGKFPEALGNVFTYTSDIGILRPGNPFLETVTIYHRRTVLIKPGTSKDLSTAVTKVVKILLVDNVDAMSTRNFTSFSVCLFVVSNHHQVNLFVIKSGLRAHKFRYVINAYHTILNFLHRSACKVSNISLHTICEQSSCGKLWACHYASH